MLSIHVHGSMQNNEPVSFRSFLVSSDPSMRVLVLDSAGAAFRPAEMSRFDAPWRQLQGRKAP